MNKRESSLKSRFIILGAGPSGIACAVTLAKSFPDEKITILEKGICSLEEYVNRDLNNHENYFAPSSDKDFAYYIESSDKPIQNIIQGQGCGGGVLVNYKACIYSPDEKSDDQWMASQYGEEFMKSNKKALEIFDSIYYDYDNLSNDYKDLHNDLKNACETLENKNNVNVLRNHIYVDKEDKNSRRLICNALDEYDNIELLSGYKIEGLKLKDKKIVSISGVRTLSCKDKEEDKEDKEENKEYFSYNVSNSQVIMSVGAIQSAELLLKNKLIEKTSPLKDHVGWLGPIYEIPDKYEMDNKKMKKIKITRDFLNDVYEFTGNLINDVNFGSREMDTHPTDILYDFTSWAQFGGHPPGPRSITKWSDKEYIEGSEGAIHHRLEFPYWHSIDRFNSALNDASNPIKPITNRNANFFKIGDRYLYNDLPEIMKHPEIEKKYNYHVTPNLQFRPNDNRTQTYISIEPWTWSDKPLAVLFTSTGIDLPNSEPITLDKKGELVVKLNYFGPDNKNKDEILKRLLDADLENNKILESLDFKLQGNLPTKEAIENGLFTFYHYMCSMPRGGKDGLLIVDDEFRVHANDKENPLENLYCCDLGTLAEPFYGSTSLVAGSLGYDCAESINKRFSENENKIDVESSMLQFGKRFLRNLLEELQK